MTWGEFKRQVEEDDVRDEDVIEWGEIGTCFTTVQATGSPREGDEPRSIALIGD